ncbi:MAG: hypothetical protein ACKOED_02735, partial [Aestuariivirga sp.]|uniref:hypothetical protein n=1 Tax=Aestuariivirga sp. TaxID=2650926 RepID=UPI0038D05506
MVDLVSRQDGDRIVIELDPGQPIELGDLSESFAALARIYERHYRPNGESAPKLYVTKLETGSVIMEVAPYAIIMGAIAAMDGTQIVADFTNRIWRGIKAFSTPATESPRLEPPSDDDARDLREFVKPLLGKKGAELGVKHARYRKTERETVVEYEFDEAELNRAAINIDNHVMHPPLFPLKDHDAPKQMTQREVMLFMQQANRSPGKEAGRTGDRGIIPEVVDKPLPVYFKGGFGRLKEQMTKDVNPLTSTFVVDVIVQYVNEEPRAYTVFNIHQAIP